MTETVVEETQKVSEADLEVLEGRFYAAAGYAAFLCLIPLVLKKGNRFAQFHGKQAFVLFIFELGSTMLNAVPVIGTLMFQTTGIFFMLLSLVFIIRALKGEYWEFPLISPIAGKITV